VRVAPWVVLLGGAILAACTPSADEPPAATPAPAVARVVPARRGPITAVLTASGETTALRTVRLAAPVTGRITVLSAQPGDRVAAKAQVARVLPVESEAAVHGLDVMRDGGALDPTERPLAEKLARDLAGRDIAVQAPFAGIVAERLKNPGELVAANDTMLEVFDPGSLVVVCQVPIEAMATVRPGQSVAVRAAGGTASGSVATLLPAVTPQSLTVPARVTLTTALVPPLLHTAVECRIVTAEHADALLIPRTALRSSASDEAGMVVVVVDGTASYRSVRLGLRDAEHIEIVDGLAPGEVVVADGGFTLPNGAHVIAQAPDAP
jgi:multidrug efflux pump subunit AcrA (membrane-fusion protein)